MTLRSALALWLVIGVTGVSADPGGCQQYAGTFVSTLVPPPGCESPVGVCTHGELVGDIEGDYDFTMDTLSCGPGPGDPCTYTGVSTVTTDKGTIETLDTGELFFIPGDLTPFTTTAAFVGGTRRYKNASGAFVATGEIAFSVGEGFGDYTLQICHGA